MLEDTVRKSQTRVGELTAQTLRLQSERDVFRMRWRAEKKERKEAEGGAGAADDDADEDGDGVRACFPCKQYHWMHVSLCPFVFPDA